MVEVKCQSSAKYLNSFNKIKTDDDWPTPKRRHGSVMGLAVLLPPNLLAKIFWFTPIHVNCTGFACAVILGTQSYTGHATSHSGLESKKGGQVAKNAFFECGA